MRLPFIIPSIAAVLLAACSTTRLSGSDVVHTDPLQNVSLDRGLIARADARVIIGIVENIVQVRVIVTNTSSVRSTLEIHGGCPVLLRAYRGNAATPAFDESNSVCTLPLGLMTLEPLQEDTLTREAHVWSIAPRGSAQATYRVEALFAANVQDHPGRYVLDAGTVTIP